MGLAGWLAPALGSECFKWKIHPRGKWGSNVGWKFPAIRLFIKLNIGVISQIQEENEFFSPPRAQSPPWVPPHPHFSSFPGKIMIIYRSRRLGISEPFLQMWKVKGNARIVISRRFRHNLSGLITGEMPPPTPVPVFHKLRNRSRFGLRSYFHKLLDRSYCESRFLFKNKYRGIWRIEYPGVGTARKTTRPGKWKELGFWLALIGETW